MATFLCSRPYSLLLPPIIDKTRASNPLLQRNCFSFSTQKTFLRGTIGVTRSGFKPDLFTDPDSAGGFVGEMFGRFEGILYTIADAAVSSSDSVNGSKQSSDWLSGITNIMETVLKVLKDGLSAFHVPYAYGFAIILLTVLVKTATFPLSKKQVESAMAMRSLQPQVKAIQQRYAGDQERIQLETARLYKLARVNPLAGCLPTLATIPVWIGLYRALSNVADEGLLTEGFFWIPSLSGPTTIAARQSGSGVSWLFPFVDGHPPLGWSDTFAYLVLPVLLVISQYISVQIMQLSQGNDPNLRSSQALTKFLPLMIGYFSLSVPSGLSLYWFTNNILSTAQQIWLQKLGGATNPVRQFSDETILEEKSKIKTSVLEVDSPKIKAEQGDKLTSGELRPGERFRRIKEQEAMKRKQREEEKMKAEEATKQAKIINEEQKKEANLIKTEDERAESAIVDGVDEITHSVSSMHDSSNNEVPHLNGGYSTPVSKEDHEKMPVPRMENGQLGGSSEADEKVEQHSYETLEKESVETYTTTTTTDNKVSGEEAHDERREQPSGRDEA